MAKGWTTPDAEQFKMKIEANYAAILGTVQAEDIMDRFVDKGYFSIADVVEKIMAKKTNNEEMRVLIQLLSERIQQHGILDFFLEQLTDNGYDKLAREIRETEIKPIQVSEGRAGTDNHRYPQIPEKLKNKVVTDKHAMFLARTFSPYKVLKFGVFLGFNETEISHVQADYRKYGESTVVQQIIIRWKNRTGFSATLGKLLEIFEKNSDDIELNATEYEKALEKISKS
ncbi:uncharacterized protein LOC117332938 [Pecten maximus]|uniref:uncharacterized protein LOC117332938 n=1 Tax=Pecten maximus TaxID=6579 RepID=UPI0014580C6B|nr:uncharacterized protein LOC117332938 [Pecten maximus]XP_033747910.1 uncharacterized protein LOC117332938 [Pecten maximus]